MVQNSKIEWTHHTFNPWRGCTKVSDGCTNCYAEKMSGRNPKTLGVWGKYGTRVVASESMWKQPLKWDRAAVEAGERHRVFCASLADVFEGYDTMPDASLEAVKEARFRLLSHIFRRTPSLDWLLLTKRPENFRQVLLDTVNGQWADPADVTDKVHAWLDGNYPPNVWIGTSVENQEKADKRIPELLKIPAKVRFLSMEPLLGPVDLSRWLRRTLTTEERNSIYDATGGMEPYQLACQKAEGDNEIQWVIVGGESGAKARPFEISWARSIIDQCKAAGVPVFVKQLGKVPYGTPEDWVHINQVPLMGLGSGSDSVPLNFEHAKGGNIDEWPEDLRVREFPNA